MKDLEKDKAKLRNLFSSVIFLGIIALVYFCIIIYNDIIQNDGNHMLLIGATPLAATFIIIYIDYRILKLKIKIIEQQSEKNEINE